MDLKDVPEFYEVDLGESLISRTETLGELLQSSLGSVRPISSRRSVAQLHCELFPATREQLLPRKHDSCPT